jgi:hypothetical protein
LGDDISGHCEKKVHMNIRLILYVIEIELFESPVLTPFDFCCWGSIKSLVYKRKVRTQDELLADVLDAASRIKKREDHLRKTSRDNGTRVAKGT